MNKSRYEGPFSEGRAILQNYGWMLDVSVFKMGINERVMKDGMYVYMSGISVVGVLSQTHIKWKEMGETGCLNQEHIQCVWGSSIQAGVGR